MNHQNNKKPGASIRILHFVVDTAVIVFSVLIMAMLTSAFMPTTDEEIASSVGKILYLFAFFGYYIYMEHTHQKTLGKIITHTKVVTENGDKPTLTNIVIRTFARLIPLEGFSYFATINGIHDRLAETILVRDDS